MTWSWRRPHPSYELLAQAADGELSASEAMELNGHLAECEECREEVDFMIELRSRLRELGTPTLPPSLLPEILGGRAAGERRILDFGDVWDDEEAEVRVRPAVPAAAAFVALAVAFALFAASGIEAGSERLELDLDPAGIVTGFEFRTAGRHADEPQLRLRAQYFQDAGRPWEVEAPPALVELDLERSGPGRFGSERGLPSSVVYAELAVETFDGRLVQAMGEGDEYVALGPDGEPTLSALLRKVDRETEAGDYAAALETATTLTRRFDDQPLAWFWLRYVEEAGFGEAAEGMLPEHERRLEDLLEAPDATTDAGHLAALAYYAKSVGRMDDYHALVDRLEGVVEAHPVAAQRREMAALGGPGGSAGVLGRLEELWVERGVGSSDVFRAALDIAVQMGPEAAVRWFDRWMVARPAERYEATARLIRTRPLTPDVIARVEATLDRLDDRMLPRPVGRSLAEHHRRIERSKMGLIVPLGRSLLEAGRADDALAAVRWIDDPIWRVDPEAVELKADVAAAVGDDRAALESHILGWAIPDPDAERLARHEAALRRAGLDEEILDARRREAREALLDIALEGEDVLRLPSFIPVRSETGVPQDLVSRLGPRATIVHFVSPLFTTTLDLRQETLASCPALIGAGIRVLTLSHDPFEPGALDVGADPECAPAPFVDAERLARKAFSSRLLGDILVVDGRARVRYRTSDPAEAQRVALLLARIE